MPATGKKTGEERDPKRLIHVGETLYDPNTGQMKHRLKKSKIVPNIGAFQQFDELISNSKYFNTSIDKMKEVYGKNRTDFKQQVREQQKAAYNAIASPAQKVAQQ